MNVFFGDNCPTTLMKDFLKKKGILRLEGKDRRWGQEVFQMEGKPVKCRHNKKLLKKVIKYRISGGKNTKIAALHIIRVLLMTETLITIYTKNSSHPPSNIRLASSVGRASDF